VLQKKVSNSPLKHIGVSKGQKGKHAVLSAQVKQQQFEKTFQAFLCYSNEVSMIKIYNP